MPKQLNHSFSISINKHAIETRALNRIVQLNILDKSIIIIRVLKNRILHINVSMLFKTKKKSSHEAGTFPTPF